MTRLILVYAEKRAAAVAIDDDGGDAARRGHFAAVGLLPRVRMTSAPPMGVARAVMVMGDIETYGAPMMLRVARVISVMAVVAPPRLRRTREGQTERNADEERERDGFKTPRVHA